MNRPARTIALLLVVVFGAAGCGLFKKAGTDADSTEAALTYGTAPLRNGKVTYQPDVVFVEGGATAIRSAGNDGLTWTIAGDARGAADIAVGKVMYVTSRAVGRVAEVRPDGRDLAVTLAPVALTEVFRDAEFGIDRDILAAPVVYQEVPGLPGAVTDPGVGPAAPLAAARLAFSAIRVSLLDNTLPPAKKGTTKVSAGNWEAEPYRASTKVGLKVGHRLDENLKVFADFSLSTKKLRVRSHILISDSVIERSSFALEGIDSIAIELAAGVRDGADSNAKVRVEVPLEINMQVPGEPFMVRQAWKFTVMTALSGKNSTLTAAGEWALDGAMGLVDGEIVAPKLTVVRSIMDSISGLAVGVSGVAFAAEVKLQFGIGMPVAFAGPYAKLVTDLGITNGSAFGAPLTRCVSATLDVKVGGGAGVTISSEAFTALEKLLPAKVKITREAETMYPIFQGSQTLPDVPLCVSGD